MQNERKSRPASNQDSKYPRAEFRLKREKIELYQSMAKYFHKKGYIREPTFNALGRVCLDIVASKYEKFGEGIEQQIGATGNHETVSRQLNNCRLQLAAQEKISSVYLNAIEEQSLAIRYLSHALTQTQERLRDSKEYPSPLGVEIQNKTQLDQFVDMRPNNFFALGISVSDSRTFFRSQ